LALILKADNSIAVRAGKRAVEPSKPVDFLFSGDSATLISNAE
jgi:hypothetical protein